MVLPIINNIFLPPVEATHFLGGHVLKLYTNKFDEIEYSVYSVLD